MWWLLCWGDEGLCPALGDCALECPPFDVVDVVGAADAALFSTGFLPSFVFPAFFIFFLSSFSFFFASFSCFSLSFFSFFSLFFSSFVFFLSSFLGETDFFGERGFSGLFLSVGFPFSAGGNGRWCDDGDAAEGLCGDALLSP